MNDRQKCKCALVCIAKNEDYYIQEWIDYHLKLGFSDVYVWQNNWRSAVAKESEHTHLKIIDGEFKQIECYNLAIDELHTMYDWIAFFDVDEFLVVKSSSGFSHVNDFLSQDKYSMIPSICVNWRIFGDSSHSSVDTWNVLRRFTKCSAVLEDASKVILHTSLTHDKAHFFYNPHCTTCFQYDPNLKFQLNGVGNNKHINNNGNDEPVELNHYRNKTYAESLLRHFNQQSVISTVKYASTIDEFNKEFANWNKNEMTNTLALSFFES